MAGNEVTVPSDPMEAFKEKITAKVRADIAELMPDEAVQRLVEAAVRDTFFKPREVDVGGGYGRTELKPSWFVEEVAKAAEPQVQAAVNAYVKKNGSGIKAAVNEFLSTQNLILITIAAMRQATAQDITHFADEIVTRLRQP